MASQAQKMEAKIKKYAESPLADLKIINAMNIQLQYANTIDEDAQAEATKILREMKL